MLGGSSPERATSAQGLAKVLPGSARLASARDTCADVLRVWTGVLPRHTVLKAEVSCTGGCIVPSGACIVLPKAAARAVIAFCNDSTFSGEHVLNH